MTIAWPTLRGQDQSWSIALQALLTMMAVSVLTLLALGLRLYHLEVFAWVPDHYNRYADAQRIVSGHLPDSKLYPQGASLIFALPVALSDSLMTLQVVTAVVGAGLVILGYVAVRQTTGDATAALILAGMTALDPWLVSVSRTGFVDVLLAALMPLLLFTVPRLRGKHPVAFAAYGALAALMATTKIQSVVIVLPIGVYWLALHGTGLRWRAILRCILQPGVMVAAATFTALLALSWSTGEWSHSGASGEYVRPGNIPGHMLDALFSSTHGVVGAILLGPSVVVGSFVLWRQDRPLALALASLLVIWLFVHTPFSFFRERYMAPATFFYLYLSAVGLSAMLRPAPHSRAGVKTKALAQIMIAIIGLAFAAGSVYALNASNVSAEITDGGMARQARSTLLKLEPGSLLITAPADAVRYEVPSLDSINLFALSIDHPEDPPAGEVSESAARALGDCRHVYYLYTQLETDYVSFGGLWNLFHVYFDRLNADYRLQEVARWERTESFDYPWVLYEVSSRTPMPGC